MSKRKKEQNIDIVYMAVSADEYELPYCTEDSIKGLAKRVNKTAIEVARLMIEGIPELDRNVKYIAVAV